VVSPLNFAILPARGRGPKVRLVCRSRPSLLVTASATRYADSGIRNHSAPSDIRLFHTYCERSRR
jgi:hypothetical protein